MTAAASDRAARRAWLFVTGALTESFLLYAVVAWVVMRASSSQTEGAEPAPTPLVVGVASALLVVTLGLARRSRRATSVASFQRLSLLSLVPLELCAIFGLVLSIRERRLEPAFVLAATAITISLLVVIPQGLAFWKQRAASSAEPPRPAGIDPA